MSDDKHTDSDQLTPEYLMALLEESECEPVSMDILATMAIVKAQLLAASENPCCGTITDAVKGHELFLVELLDEESFDQYLLKAHMGRQLPPEWPLWVNYTRNLYVRYSR
jgi:hypothetical protein